VSPRFWVEASGVCMWPALREGDLLLCEPLPEGPPPSPGEVLVAREGTRFVAHRLRRSHGPAGRERFVLGADLGPADPPRRREEIVGRVLLVHRSPEGLLEVAPPFTGKAEIGPLEAALLRRLARWHTDSSRKGDRIQRILPLESGDGAT